MASLQYRNKSQCIAGVVLNSQRNVSIEAADSMAKTQQARNRAHMVAVPWFMPCVGRDSFVPEPPLSHGVWMLDPG